MRLLLILTSALASISAVFGSELYGDSGELGALFDEELFNCLPPLSEAPDYTPREGRDHLKEASDHLNKIVETLLMGWPADGSPKGLKQRSLQYFGKLSSQCSPAMFQAIMAPFVFENLSAKDKLSHLRQQHKIATDRRELNCAQLSEKVADSLWFETTLKDLFQDLPLVSALLQSANTPVGDSSFQELVQRKLATARLTARTQLLSEILGHKSKYLEFSKDMLAAEFRLRDFVAQLYLFIQLLPGRSVFTIPFSDKDLWEALLQIAELAFNTFGQYLAAREAACDAEPAASKYMTARIEDLTAKFLPVLSDDAKPSWIESLFLLSQGIKDKRPLKNIMTLSLPVLLVLERMRQSGAIADSLPRPFHKTVESQRDELNRPVFRTFRAFSFSEGTDSGRRVMAILSSTKALKQSDRESLDQLASKLAKDLKEEATLAKMILPSANHVLSKEVWVNVFEAVRTIAHVYTTTRTIITQLLERAKARESERLYLLRHYLSFLPFLAELEGFWRRVRPFLDYPLKFKPKITLSSIWEIFPESDVSLAPRDLPDFIQFVLDPDHLQAARPVPSAMAPNANHHPPERTPSVAPKNTETGKKRKPRPLRSIRPSAPRKLPSPKAPVEKSTGSSGGSDPVASRRSLRIATSRAKAESAESDKNAENSKGAQSDEDAESVPESPLEDYESEPNDRSEPEFCPEPDSSSEEDNSGRRKFNLRVSGLPKLPKKSNQGQSDQNQEKMTSAKGSASDPVTL